MPDFKVSKRCRALILPCMALKIHTNPADIPIGFQVAYFQKGYIASQAYSQFIAYSDENFFIPFNIEQQNAISIPRSPFGSVIGRNGSAKGIKDFVDMVFANLKERGVKSMVIHHPPQIYESFIAETELLKSGFRTKYHDLNQHIELSDRWEESIHKMQKRKLNSLRDEGFFFRKMERTEFETAHKFIAVCRQAQGLQINISLEQLTKLNEQLPGVYECFGVFRGDKISALCITANADANIAYYYLPATSPMFRDKSPMVLLIAGMVDYYNKNGFRYLDLGVSSVQGKTQETLRLFKERMGAVETQKSTFTKKL